MFRKFGKLNDGMNEDRKGCSNKSLDGNKNATGDLTADQCYGLARNLSTFCLCPETSRESRFKGDG